MGSSSAMTFKIDREQLRELAAIEAESGCDITAGLDWGSHTATYLRCSGRYLDREKLLLLLQEELGNLLTPEDIEAIAIELHNRTQDLVTAKLQQV